MLFFSFYFLLPAPPRAYLSQVEPAPSPAPAAEAAPASAVRGPATPVREEPAEICGICREELPPAGEAALRCGHPCHTLCMETLCRRFRHPAPSPVGDHVFCPVCRVISPVDALITFEGSRRPDPPPLDPRHGTLSDWARGDDGVRLDARLFLGAEYFAEPVHVLAVLENDIARVRLPPFDVPDGWTEFVLHVRDLPPRMNLDNVVLPLLNRDERARGLLLEWAREVHRRGRDGGIPPFPWGQHAAAGVDDVPRLPACQECRLPIGAPDAVRLPCPSASDYHALHRDCAEALLRRRRRQVNGVVVFGSPCCHSDCDVAALGSFRGTNPRPLPRRIRDRLDGTEWNENIIGYTRRSAADGVPVDGLLADLGRDVLGVRWPPFVPPTGWRECVAAHRSVLGRASHMPPGWEVCVAAHGSAPLHGVAPCREHDVLRRCGSMGSTMGMSPLDRWLSDIRRWVEMDRRDHDQVPFPEFPGPENWSWFDPCRRQDVRFRHAWVPGVVRLWTSRGKVPDPFHGLRLFSTPTAARCYPAFIFFRRSSLFVVLLGGSYCSEHQPQHVIPLARDRLPPPA